MGKRARSAISDWNDGPRSAGKVAAEPVASTWGLRTARTITRCLLSAACVASLLEPAHGQVTDLSVQESAQDASLSWGTGVGPYRVLRSASPDFYSGNHVVTAGTSGSAVTDPRALQPGNHSYFYEVVVQAENDPPGFGANPPPLPAPVITSISPNNSGKPGDLRVINGTGFLADGSRMIVTFHHAIADIVDASETQLTVTVPAGAYSGDVVVCIASDICSNPFLFDITYGPTFVDLSAIAYEAGTKSLWVSDRVMTGSPGTVYEIDSSGALFSRGSLAKAVLGHPSPANGNGRVYFCNSSTNATNFGSINYVDSATNAVVFFDRAGDSGTETVQVRCEGLAASDLEPNVVYFLDGVGNTVRRIVRDALIHDLMYGDQPFSFGDPSGARFDSAGNLYISSTTAIHRISPNEAAVELVASGFTAAAGIDLVEVGGDTLIAVADKGAGKVWLLRVGNPAKFLVRTGLSGPVGVAFADDPAAGMTGLYIAEPTRVLRLPDPRLRFVVEQDQRVLLSKAWSDDVYPSAMQVANRQIGVRLQLNTLMDPAGKSAYFRLVDPRDPSPYMVLAADGDNGQGLGLGGHSLTAQAPFGGDGLALATLTVDDEYSGNNYRVEASLAGGADFRPLAVSPVYTTWRRSYIEHDSMWKEGSWITDDSGFGKPNPRLVKVADPSIFIQNEPVWILSGSTLKTAVGELAEVTLVDIPTSTVTLDRDLKNLYIGGPSDEAPYSYLARVDGGVYGDAPNPRSLAGAFDDAFAEWVVLRTGAFVPHFTPVPGPDPDLAEPYISPRAPLFFNAQREHGSDEGFLNTVQVISAWSATDRPTLYGLTLTSPNQNWSWIFNGNIEDEANFPVATQPDVRASVVAHELAHQFDVNQGAPGFHDSQPAWTGSPKCLMDSSRNRTLGVVKMHAPVAGQSNDLMCIRSHADNLDSSTFCWVP